MTPSLPDAVRLYVRLAPAYSTVTDFARFRG